MNKKTIKISQLTPGMKLAENITNAAGVTIMPIGIRLTPMFISRLAKWEIDAVGVFQDEGADVAADGQASQQPATKESITRIAASKEQEEFARSITVEVASWFVNVKTDPLMMQLRAVAIKKLISIGPDSMINVMRRTGSVPGERKT